MAHGILILGLNGCGKTTVGRAEEEVHRMMEADVGRCDGFVLSCVRCNVPDSILRHVRLAVVLRASPELRAERIRQREVLRFGSRVLPGGDMYESRLAFRAFAAGRTEETVDCSLFRLACPIADIRAELTPEEIVDQICMNWQSVG